MKKIFPLDGFKPVFVRTLPCSFCNSECKQSNLKYKVILVGKAYNIQ